MRSWANVISATKDLALFCKQAGVKRKTIVFVIQRTSNRVLTIQKRACIHELVNW